MVHVFLMRIYHAMPSSTIKNYAILMDVNSMWTLKPVVILSPATMSLEEKLARNLAVFGTTKINFVLTLGIKVFVAVLIHGDGVAIM